MSQSNFPTQDESRSRSTVKVLKRRVSQGGAERTEEDFLAIEDPLEITLSYLSSGIWCRKKLAVTMRTPGDDVALIHGFLHSEGIIRSSADITRVEFTGKNPNAAPTAACVTLEEGSPMNFTRERNFNMYSSCGVCGTTSLEELRLCPSLIIGNGAFVSGSLLHEIPSIMEKKQTVYQTTGGLHASALFSTSGKLLVSREDIGRHNALDKVIGASLLQGMMPAGDCILCVSGRMSYEIIQKSLIARIPIIIGVGAPSSLAVALANDFNITLVGFVRNGSYSIYSNPERIQ